MDVIMVAPPWPGTDEVAFSIETHNERGEDIIIRSTMSLAAWYWFSNQLRDVLVTDLTSFDRAKLEAFLEPHLLFTKETNE